MKKHHNFHPAHKEVSGDELARMKASLKPGHVIHTLVCEHEVILGFLDKLEKVNQNTQRMGSYDDKKEEFKKLLYIAKHLVEAEPHYQREEKVLFPEVEKRGVLGPPQVMRMEHDGLRKSKKELMKLAEKVGRKDFADFKKRLNRVTKFIILTLRDHIFKENNILYPAALEVIREVRLWERMKLKADRIGYCCFTPEA